MKGFAGVTDKGREETGKRRKGEGEKLRAGMA